MNIPPLIPIKADHVKQYLKQAIELTLTHQLRSSDKLSKEEKIIISKIYKNLNIICKLTVKQAKEVIKTEPAYQEALADLYFDKKINNCILITNYGQPQNQKDPHEALLQSSRLSHSNECTDIQYRIEFTLSSIAKKSVMKPVVLLIFRVSGGNEVSFYFNLQQFWQLRYQICQGMKQIYGIELRTI